MPEYRREGDEDDDDEFPCRRESDRAMAQLRRDLEDKHSQNRRDIHAIRNEQQKATLELAVMKTKFAPLVDNGQPGLISRMNTKLDQVLIAQGTDTGRRAEWDWVRDGVKALIVGAMLVLAQHFWK